ILIIDVVVYFIIFAIGILLLGTIGEFVAFGQYMTRTPSHFLTLYIISLSYHLGTFPPLVEDLPIRWLLVFILFWAGFVPSIWMWLEVAALFVTRALLRSEKLVNWLRWALDVEKSPFRSIGAVAATLAFIVTVAIIFASAEVSRISAA